MTTEKFVKKNIIRILIVAIIIMAVSAFSSTFHAVVNNYISLDQMQNDDVAFIIKEMYNNFVRPTCSIITSISIVAFIGFTTYDVIKFIKKKKED